MKKLKVKQLGSWCQFCEPKTTRATHVGRGFNGFACEAHKPELREIEEKDDGHMSEGDRQAWGHF